MSVSVLVNKTVTKCLPPLPTLHFPQMRQPRRCASSSCALVHPSFGTCNCPALSSAALLRLCLCCPYLRHGPAPCGAGRDPCPREEESCGMLSTHSSHFWGHHKKNGLIMQSLKVWAGVQNSAVIFHIFIFFIHIHRNSCAIFHRCAESFSPLRETLKDPPLLFLLSTQKAKKELFSFIYHVNIRG